jgi:hypothetical protein
MNEKKTEKPIIDRLPEAIDKVIAVIDSTKICLSDIAPADSEDDQGEISMRYFLLELATTEPAQRRKILHALTDFVVWDE